MGDLERNEQLELAAMEERLRQSLAHVPAPEGFADRVMARVETRRAAATMQAGKRTGATLLGARNSGSRRGWWLSAAAAVLLTVAGGDLLHLRHVHAEQQAAAAQQQIDRALLLTDHALQQVDGGLERSHAARLTEIAYNIGK